VVLNQKQAVNACKGDTPAAMVLVVYGGVLELSGKTKSTALSTEGSIKDNKMVRSG
jgi:hypothetical protein